MDNGFLNGNTRAHRLTKSRFIALTRKKNMDNKRNVCEQNDE